jgi:hypothetical protein
MCISTGSVLRTRDDQAKRPPFRPADGAELAPLRRHAEPVRGAHAMAYAMDGASAAGGGSRRFPVSGTHCLHPLRATGPPARHAGRLGTILRNAGPS